MTHLISEINRIKSLAGIKTNKLLINEQVKAKLFKDPLEAFIRRLAKESGAAGISKAAEMVGKLDPKYYQRLIAGDAVGAPGKYVDLSKMSTYGGDKGQRTLMDDLTLFGVEGMEEAFTETTALVIFRIMNETNPKLVDDYVSELVTNKALLTTLRQAQAKGGVPTKVIDDVHGFATKTGDEYVPSQLAMDILGKGTSRKTLKAFGGEIPVSFRKVKLKPTSKSVKAADAVAKTTRNNWSFWKKILIGGGKMGFILRALGIYFIVDAIASFWDNITDPLTPLCANEETRRMFQNDLEKCEQYLDVTAAKETAENLYAALNATTLGIQDQDPGVIRREFRRINNLMQASYVGYLYRLLEENKDNTTLCKDVENLDVGGLIGTLIKKVETMTDLEGELDFGKAWVEEYISNLPILTENNGQTIAVKPSKVEEIASQAAFNMYPSALLPVSYTDPSGEYGDSFIIGGCAGSCEWNFAFDNAQDAYDQGFLYDVDRWSLNQWGSKYKGPMRKEYLNKLSAALGYNPNNENQVDDFINALSMLSPARFNEIVGATVYSIDYLNKTPQEDAKATPEAVADSLIDGLESLENFKDEILDELGKGSGGEETSFLDIDTKVPMMAENKKIEGLGSLLK